MFYLEMDISTILNMYQLSEYRKSVQNKAYKIQQYGKRDVDYNTVQFNCAAGWCSNYSTIFVVLRTQSS